MYDITPYTKRQAKRLGVQVKQSSNPKKKIDVYRDGVKIASIGDINYGDYPTFLRTKHTRKGKYKNSKAYANSRRVVYKLRHEKDRHVKGTPGYYSDQLLW
jgi:N-acyl-D-aspartate/D-glutamate deacylase